MNKYKYAFLATALIVLSSHGQVVQANPPIYENFKGKVLNSGRWLGGRVDEGTIETRRKIRGKENALHLKIRGHADDLATTGERYKVTNRIWVNANVAPQVRSLQTFVKVNEASVGECPLAGAIDSQSAVENLGIWFNTGESSQAEDRLGDVYTTIGLRQSAENGIDKGRLQIRAFVGKCADYNCDTSSIFYSQSLGTYEIGSKIVLRTTWDNDAQEFRFYARPQQQDAIATKFSYSDIVANNATPGTRITRRHGVQVRSDAADCNMSDATFDYPFGQMDALIYNVRISETSNGL